MQARMPLCLKWIPDKEGTAQPGSMQFQKEETNASTKHEWTVLPMETSKGGDSNNEWDLDGFGERWEQEDEPISGLKLPS